MVKVYKYYEYYVQGPGAIVNLDQREINQINGKGGSGSWVELGGDDEGYLQQSFLRMKIAFSTRRRK